EDSNEDNAKKWKLKDDAEKKELRDSMDVVLRGDIAIDVESLATKYLIGDLKILFEPNEDDEIWKNQQDYNLISWRLFDSCGIHILLMSTRVAIHMMVEKKYPLTQEMLSRMLKVMEFESAQSNTTAKLPILKLAQENGTSITKMSVPVTAEKKTNKKNDVKARSVLLMALPNEHQLTFSQYNDAKTMFATIETRFGESLDSIFNGLQNIVSRLVILGVVITQEDLNSKFLRSLPLEWNTHVVVGMNKADIKIMSIDDLYNNFKIIEQDVKKSIGASNLEQIHKDDLEAMDLKWQLSLLSMRAKRAPRNKEGQFKYQDNTKKQGNNEDTSSKVILAIDGEGFDWSDMAEEQVQTNMALMAFLNSKVYNDKTCTKTCLKNYETLKK
ncbi:hypothetical protein Tco_1141623, partial [Tanacetum coccineum]